MDQSVSPSVARAAAPAPLHVSAPSIGLPPRGSVWSRGRARLPFRPRFLAAAAVVLLALAYGGRELYLRFTHIYEYDARVTADIVTISSRADGWVVEMPAREGARVEAGRSSSASTIASPSCGPIRLQAQIEGVRAERTRLQAERRLTANQADASIKHAHLGRHGAREGAGGAAVRPRLREARARAQRTLFDAA